MGWVLIMVCIAQVEAPKAGPAVRREPMVQKVPDPHDASVWALADLMQMDAHERPLTFYAWGGPDQTKATAPINSLVVNSALSQSAAMQFPKLPANGRLLRYNLRQLCPKHNDLQRAVGVMNYLALNEPYWHLNTAELGLPPVTMPPFLWIDGKSYTTAITIPSPTTADSYTLLMKETGLLAPLLHHGDFMRRLSSSYDDEGGVYYDAIGFRRHRKPLTEAEIFSTIGLSTDLSRKVEGDDRVGVLHSGIAGNKPRVVEAIQGAVGSARITYDVNDGVTRGTVRRHLIYHLIDAVNRANGKEIIVDRSNGLLGYILTDGNGKLVSVGPQNLVTDHRVPEPYTANLFPPVSCVRCHAATGGVKPCPNDVPILARRGGPDIFDDLGARTPDEAVDRLLGLYGGGTDFDNRLTDTRIKYGNAVFKATQGMKAKEAGEEWARQYAEYWYELIDAEQQLLELGWQARSKPAAIAALRVLMKPEKRSKGFDNLIDDDPLLYAPSAEPRQIANSRPDHERTFGEQFKRASRYRTKDLNAAIEAARVERLEVAP